MHPISRSTSREWRREFLARQAGEGGGRGGERGRSGNSVTGLVTLANIPGGASEACRARARARARESFSSSFSRAVRSYREYSRVSLDGFWRIFKLPRETESRVPRLNLTVAREDREKVEGGGGGGGDVTASNLLGVFRGIKYR